MGCTFWLVVPAVGVFVLASLLRWFERTADAVDHWRWGEVGLLLVMPFAVWLYPSPVSAGRPVPVPRHEPVAGMGAAPRRRAAAPEPSPAPEVRPAPVLGPDDEPPPGTQAEFLGMPVVPPKAKPPRAGADPEQVEKLRRKMREQGMLPPGDDVG